MAARVAYIKPTPVLNGTVIDKETATIGEVMRSNTEMRIMPDDSLPNTSGSPTIQEYINLESGSGYKVVQITNTAIITDNS
jgi:hypothetical protein